MGQKPSTSNLSQNFLLPELSFQKQLPHPAYGEIKIYQNTNSHDFYALRTILKDSKAFDTSLPLKLQQYQAITSNDSLVKLIKSECIEHKELCSNFNRINMLFEYFPKSLAAEYQIRRQNKENFVELDLIHIFIALISALHALKSQNIDYSDLIPNHILLSRTGLAKLTPLDDLTGFNRYNKLFFGSRDGLYVSPEQLRAFGDKIDSKEFINDHEKENVFSVGMILLEGMTLAEVKEYYDLGTYSVKFEVIEKILIESNASDSFKLLLRRMLDPEAENRPTYEELLGEVTNFKDNFLGIKLHCYSVKETSEINIVPEQHEQNINQIMENQRKISAFNEENQDGPPQTDLFGFSNYVAPDERKGGTPLLNLQEIGLNPTVSLKEMNLQSNQRELVDIAWFRSHMEQLVNEGLSISEEIQRKYHVLTNKKPVYPEDFDPNTIQSYYFLKRESNSPKNSSIVLKKVDSSTNMTNDYHYFARGNTTVMSPLHNRRSMDLTENKNSAVHNMIKNFDYNLTGTPLSGQKRLERKKTTKLRSMNISPKKGVTSSSNGKNDKKYYTPKRDPTDKMKLKESGSTKKPSIFKDRPVTPNYENLYWDALRKKF